MDKWIMEIIYGFLTKWNYLWISIYSWEWENAHGFQKHDMVSKTMNKRQRKKNLFLKCKMTEKFSSTWFSTGDVVF